MARKIAIVLRGPMGGGKSTVTSALQEIYSLPKNSHVELDQFWGEGQKRYVGSCRYWDLRDQADVLIIQLGYGEPAGERFFGASRNPREWVSILEADMREVFFFLLSVPEAESVSRVGKRNGSNAAYVSQAWNRYQPGGGCSSTEFIPRVGTRYSEETIDTSQTSLCNTVMRILSKIGSV
jgi:hypothetical protein